MASIFKQDTRTDDSYEFMSPSNDRLFEVGKQFPPENEIERLSKNKRYKALFDGKHKEVFNRANSVYRSKVKTDQLRTLYLAVNILGILTTKPSDMMFQDAPSYETDKGHKSKEQKALNRIVTKNKLNLLGQEITTGAGYRGDSFLKVFFNYREDLSDLPYIPKSHRMEPIIEAQDPSTVFPELAKNSRKKFKAFSIAHVEWEDNLLGNAVPYLAVERHLAGFIEYSRFKLKENAGAFSQGITVYDIIEEIHLPDSLVETGVPNPLVFHVPYQTTDEQWQGIGTAERIEDLIAAVNDRLVQIDYILYKHSDPNMYGPDLSDSREMTSGGVYIPVRKDEIAPNYLTFDGKLEAAFRELELLLSLIYQVAETPQWLFGTSVGNAGGTGTSHTDSGSIKARFMPILTKVKRIRTHVDHAFKDAIKSAMILDNEGNAAVEGFESYEPTDVSIMWNDGLPRDEKSLAETWAIRTGNKATAAVRSAIKDMDGLSDDQIDEEMKRIQDEEDAALSTVDSQIFNQQTANITDEAVEEEISKDKAGDE